MYLPVFLVTCMPTQNYPMFALLARFSASLPKGIINTIATSFRVIIETKADKAALICNFGQKKGFWWLRHEGDKRHAGHQQIVSRSYLCRELTRLQRLHALRGTTGMLKFRQVQRL